MLTEQLSEPTNQARQNGTNEGYWLMCHLTLPKHTDLLVWESVFSRFDQHKSVTLSLSEAGYIIGILDLEN